MYSKTDDMCCVFCVGFQLDFLDNKVHIVFVFDLKMENSGALNQILQQRKSIQKAVDGQGT